jgi:prepilin-type N-terminal cleavage/methylation domain-containing protein
LTSSFFGVILKEIVKFFRLKFSSGFTIVELLVALAVLAIISTAVVIAINPAEQMAKSRDTNRKATVKQLATALEAMNITKCSGTSCSATYPTTNQISSNEVSARWASYVVGGGNCGGPCTPRYIAPVPTIPYVGPIDPCLGQGENITEEVVTIDENGTRYSWFEESGFCYGVTDDGTKAIISSGLESAEEIKKCKSTGKAFIVWTSSGKHGIYCDQTGIIKGSTEYDNLPSLPPEDTPGPTRVIETPPPYSSPTPTTPFVHPTDEPSDCTVTTTPRTINLLVGKTNAVTASVTSGLNGRTITRMRFGTYSPDMAMVSPGSITTSPYSTTVAGLVTGNTAVWATADLSDGTVCESTGETDTNVNVYIPDEFLQVNGENCTDGVQCKSGYCVGAVCCASPFCPQAGLCQTGGGSCTGGTCAPIANVPVAQNPNNDCSGVISCSGFVTRTKNACDGSGACANLDSSIVDCAGTCASYCNNGNCVNTNTTNYDTCDVPTNNRVASGGTGRCEAGVCKGEFRFTSQWAVLKGGHPPGPGLGWDYYTYKAVIHNYGTTAKAVTVGTGMGPGMDYPPVPPTTILYGAINSPILQPGESWTYTYPDENMIGVCNGSDACRPRSIVIRIVPLGQTTGSPYYDTVVSTTPGSSNAGPWSL